MSVHTWVVRAGAAIMIITGTAGLASCGPDDAETRIRINSEEPGADTVVVHDRSTVIEQRTDTVVTEGTVIEHRTDTVVKTVPGGTVPTTTIPPAEQARIDAWLTRHSDSLNQYGDPKDMVYTGGTPLFNEATGQSISKYEYIVNKHPDRPWNRM